MPADTYPLISADSHVALPLAGFRPYLDARFHDAFDSYAAARGESDGERKEGMLEVFKDAFDDSLTRLKAFVEHPSLTPDGCLGLFDPIARLEDLDDQGVTGEVLIPDFAPWDIPFAALDAGFERRGGLVRKGERYAPELVRAGCHAWNRWMADFCSAAPERLAGVALLPMQDVDAAVAEVRWARDAGLRGGIMLPSWFGDTPGYHDPAYDPIWAACAEYEMPVNVHVGNDMPDYGGKPESFALAQTEMLFFGRRALWFFLWGGVFERHPDLRFVLTEQDCYWVPQTLRELEDIMDGRFSGAAVRARLSLRPTEYFRRQCYVSATVMSRNEAERRHEIGVDRIMWAGDYPHIESTWPYTQLAVRNTFHSIPEAEVRLMVAENAARVFGFDLEKLAPVAERIGPRVDEIAQPVPDGDLPEDYVGEGFRNPVSHR